MTAIPDKFYVVVLEFHHNLGLQFSGFIGFLGPIMGCEVVSRGLLVDDLAGEIIAMASLRIILVNMQLWSGVGFIYVNFHIILSIYNLQIKCQSEVSHRQKSLLAGMWFCVNHVINPLKLISVWQVSEP